MKEENNRVALTGEIMADFEYSHEVLGEKFYTSYLWVRRKSGTEDQIPVLVSERLLRSSENLEVSVGSYVKISGSFRSYNKYEEEKNRLIISVFVEEIESAEMGDADVNSIVLNGYICKPPVYRQTPQGREITDVLLAVNRAYGKSDYIPCICWGRNARYVETLSVGSNIEFSGRIQSREYDKKNADGSYTKKITYEVSVSKLQ